MLAAFVQFWAELRPIISFLLRLRRRPADLEPSLHMMRRHRCARPSKGRFTRQRYDGPGAIQGKHRQYLLRKELIATQDGVTIRYTGGQLDQADLLIFLLFLLFLLLP